MHQLFGSSLAALCFATAPLGAHAIPVTVNLAGQVAVNRGTPFALGTPAGVTFSYESAVPPNFTNPNIGTYSGAVTAFTLNLGGTTYSVRNPALASIIVVNDGSDSTGAFDLLSPRDMNRNIDGPTLPNGDAATQLYVFLYDRTQAALSSGALPEAVDPRHFNDMSGLLIFSPPNTIAPSGFVQIAFSAAGSVPLPSTFALLAGGLVVGWAYASGRSVSRVNLRRDARSAERCELPRRQGPRAATRCDGHTGQNRLAQ